MCLFSNTEFGVAIPQTQKLVLYYKDFLSQFSNENKKPDSFLEEERIKVTKERNPVNVKLLIIILSCILVVLGVVLFFLFRPTIEVKNFVGLNASEVKAWIKQNEIETQGIIFREEYNFDYDEGIVIYQSIEDGKKVRKNVKLDFTVSLGADPEELINVPDIESMYKEEIQTWIKDNKLQKTKLTTTYSDDVEEGRVISYEFKNSDADTFKRSSSLNISISKGPQPAGTVQVPDFEKKLYSEVETWAKTNNIELKKVSSYSDKIDKDYVISQSVEAKKEIKEGDTFTVYVSLGKAVYAKNLINMSIDDANRWASKNGVYLVIDYQYSNYSKDTVIYQSIAEDTIIKDEDMKITVSLGRPDLSSATTIQELERLVNQLNKQGANLNLNKGNYNFVNSDTVDVDHLIDNFGEVKVGTVIKPNISKGKNIWLKDLYEDDVEKDEDGNPIKYRWSEVRTGTEDDVRKFFYLAGVTYEVKYKPSQDVQAHKVISVTLNDEDFNISSQGQYISESEVIVITICEEYTGS